MMNVKMSEYTPSEDMMDFAQVMHSIRWIQKFSSLGKRDVFEVEAGLAGMKLDSLKKRLYDGEMPLYFGYLLDFANDEIARLRADQLEQGRMIA